MKFGGNFFQTNFKFFSRLSHKGCRLLSSSVLLRMFTKVSQMKQSLNLVTKFPVLQSKRGWREETLKSSFTNCLFVCFAVAVVVIIIFHWFGQFEASPLPVRRLPELAREENKPNKWNTVIINNILILSSTGKSTAPSPKSCNTWGTRYLGTLTVEWISRE